MVDFTEIDREIIKIETERDTSYATIERLAPLYAAAIYRRLTANPEVYEARAIDSFGESDFLVAVAGKDSQKAWAIMDELMDTLQIANPKVYASVMRKIAAI